MSKRCFLRWFVGVALVGLLSAGCFNPVSQASGWSGASPTDDGLYVGSRHGKVVAFDPGTGERLWVYPRGDDVIKPIYSTPAVDANNVYVGGGDGSGEGKVFALDVATGEPIRGASQTVGIPSTDITLVENKLIVGSNDGDRGTVTAFDKTSGKRIWKFPKDDQSPIGKIYSSPVSDGERVYFGTMDGRLIALSLARGNDVWTFPPLSDEPVGPIASTPRVHQGTVFVGSFDKYLYAIDASKGRQKWKGEAENWIWSKPVISGSMVLVGSLDHKMYGFSVTTGQMRCHFVADDAIRSDAALSEDGETLIFAAKSGNVYALDLPASTCSGPESLFARKWNSSFDRIESGVMAPINIKNGMAFLPAFNDNLYALDVENGTLRWSKAIKE